MKYTLFILLTLCTFGIAQSQVSLRPQFGINFPKLTDEISQGHFKGNTGYQFGLDLQLGQEFYIQPGLNFETQSMTLRDGEDVGDINIGRINIPVLVGFHLAHSEDNAVGLRGYFGPNFAINVNEDLDESLSFISVRNIRDSQISGIAGAGLDLSIFFVDAGYKFGLSRFFEDINSDAKVNEFIINAGLRLGF